MARFTSENNDFSQEPMSYEDNMQLQAEIDSIGARPRSEGASYYIELREEEVSAKKRKRIRAIVITLCSFLVAALVAGFIILRNLPQFNTVNDDGLSSALTQEVAGDPFYMLLLGIDKSEVRSSVLANPDDFHNYRADTIILARVDPKTPLLTLVSIHRDTLVNLGANGQQKINAAYAIGGPSYMTKVVSDFAGVPISHYAEIDFDGLMGLIDTLGGIDINLPIDVIDEKYARGNLKAGDHHLTSEEALFLARARHAYDAYGDGDAYRAANQRMIISAIIKKVLASNPTQWPTLINQMTEYVKVDPGLTSQFILSLAWQMQNLNTATDIYTGMDPTTSKYTNNLWYEICNVPAWNKMMERVNKGLPPYENDKEDPTKGVAADANALSAPQEETSSSSSEQSATPVKSGTVTVLNASNIKGAAGTVANRLNASGFTANPGNHSSKLEQCTIVYNGSNEGKALGAKDTLGDKFTVSKNDGSFPTDTDIVVVIGANYQ